MFSGVFRSVTASFRPRGQALPQRMATSPGQAAFPVLAGSAGGAGFRPAQPRAGAFAVPYPAAALNTISANKANVITWTLVHHRQMAPILNSSQ